MPFKFRVSSFLEYFELFFLPFFQHSPSIFGLEPPMFRQRVERTAPLRHGEADSLRNFKILDNFVSR